MCSRHEAQPPIRIPYKRAVQGQLHLVMTTTTMNHNLSAGCTGDAMPTRSFLKPHLRCLEGPFKLSTHGPGASPFLAISTQKYLGPCSDPDGRKDDYSSCPTTGTGMPIRNVVSVDQLRKFLSATKLGVQKAHESTHDTSIKCTGRCFCPTRTAWMVN